MNIRTLQTGLIIGLATTLFNCGSIASTQPNGSHERESTHQIPLEEKTIQINGMSLDYTALQSNEDINQFITHFDDFENYSRYSQEERDDLINTTIEALGIQPYIDTPQGPFWRNYSLPNETSIDDLLVINNSNINEQTTWDRDVLIESSVVYDYGITNTPLTIEPGVTVYFGYDAISDRGIDLYGPGTRDTADLTITGPLQAKGTLDERISFVPISVHPEWEEYSIEHNDYTATKGGLHFEGQEEQIAFEFCYFITRPHFKGEEVTVRYSIFRGGAYIEKEHTTSADYLFDSNYFYDPYLALEGFDIHSGFKTEELSFQGNYVGPTQVLALEHTDWLDANKNEFTAFGETASIVHTEAGYQAEENVFFFTSLGGHSEDPTMEDSILYSNNDFLLSFIHNLNEQENSRLKDSYLLTAWGFEDHFPTIYNGDLSVDGTRREPNNPIE